MNIKIWTSKKSQSFQIRKKPINNGGVSMLTLSQIREKNRTSTSLLGSTIEEKQYSKELIEQCENEFKTFVKPIRDNVVKRMLGEKGSFLKKHGDN